MDKNPAGRRFTTMALMCALALSGVLVSNASAAGTTAFTCKNTEKGPGFSEADCETASSTGPYQHVEIAAGTSTALQTVATTNFAFHGTPAGINTTIQATGVNTTGTIKNVAGPPMSVSSEETIEFTGATVTEPSGKGCVVKGGTITTEPLVNESIIGELATTTGIRFKPKTGSTFTKITLEGCSVSALNGTFPVTGTDVGTPKGTTLEFSEATSKGLLLFGGNAASLTGKVTVSGKATGDSAFTGLSMTTTSS